MSDEAFIRFDAIAKRFGGVQALDDISFSIARGEVHGLMGENGAGKSTLGKILAGIHAPDAGRIELDGKTVAFRSAADALRAGVGMVHQELAFCPDLSVAENLCLSHLPRHWRWFADRTESVRRAERILYAIGVQIDVRRPMRELSTAQEQLVQIAAAVATDARVLVLDEPTSSLSETESLRLFDLIRRLRGRGVTIIYVSHRMPEVFELCDRMSVLRDGRYVGTVRRDATSPDELVRLMVGRVIERREPRHLERQPGRVVLAASDIGSTEGVIDANLTVRAGEIVGLAGLVGAGRSELARAIFGLDACRGRVEVDGVPLPPASPRAAMAAGVALVPEDRKRQGLILDLGGRVNVSLAMLDGVSRAGFLRRGAERALAIREYARLAVKAPSVESPVGSLSGGNQQKVALAKWLVRNPRVLIVDEPTRGVDVAAKAAIHALLDDLACRGVAILLISSELPELLLLSSRLLVMRGGRIVGELPRRHATQENVMRLMAGVERRAGGAVG
jgi:ABC-type sugar transport system ATPase subunit